nr:hypothetical protein [Tanacetum cinerariifolium]
LRPDAARPGQARRLRRAHRLEPARQRFDSPLFRHGHLHTGLPLEAAQAARYPARVPRPRPGGQPRRSNAQ